jgi:glycosyltransferase involved in cell wall biosynthesis
VPKVSVIIPTYNRAEYVTQAIDSVLAQTYEDCEIIVVDDGSTDKTREALEPYMDRITYIYQENAGVSAARNTGIKAAKGDWVAFLDSDDEWLPEKLAVQMRAVERHPQLVAHMVNVNLTNYNDPYPNSFLHCKFPFEENEGIIDDPFIQHFKYRTIAMPVAIMCRKECAIKAGLFDESFVYGEDYDFVCRLALQGSWGYCWDELAMMYRRCEKTVSLSDLRKDYTLTLRNRIKTHKKLLEYELTELERKVVLSYLVECFRALGMIFLLRREGGEARKAYEEACSVRPELKCRLGRLLASTPVWFGSRVAHSWVCIKRAIARAE